MLPPPGLGHASIRNDGQLGAGTPHNRLLLSICHAMGLTDVTAFGNPKFCTAGPIKEMLA